MMQERAAADRPAFSRFEWSGFGCAGVVLTSFIVFVIVQGGASALVLFRLHPEALRIIRLAALGIPPPHYSQLVDGWTRDALTAPYLFLYAVIGDGAMIVVALILARKWLGTSLPKFGLARFKGARHVGVGIVSGIGLIIVSNLVTSAQAALFGPHPEKVAQLLRSHHGLFNFGLDLASVAILAPFAEELLFRGVVFAGLVQRMPLWLAAALSGLIFGAAHLDLWSIVPLAVIGAGLGVLYYRTGSLWPNIVAHATVNAVALVAVYYLPQFAT